MGQMKKKNAMILILIGALLILMSFSVPSTASIIQTDTTFGFSNLGTYNGDYTTANIKEAQRVQMGNIEGASVTHITFYCWTTNPANVRCAIYADNDGLPGNLLGQTNEVLVGVIERWVTFTLDTPVPVYPTGCYWLAWMSSTSVYYTMQGGGEVADGYMDVWNSNSYGSFPDTFGTATQVLYGVSTNIYATFETSAQPTATPNPYATPTPTPTLNPYATPTPTDAFTSPTPEPTPTPSIEQNKNALYLQVAGGLASAVGVIGYIKKPTK